MCLTYSKMSYNDTTSPSSKLTCKVLSQRTRIIEHHAEELLSCVLHFTGTKKVERQDHHMYYDSTTEMKGDKYKHLLYNRKLKGEAGQK